ncbi:MAG TPA: aspartate 1-decarboxylase [Candidatus Wirthbacteria bacterium]|nr:aspartate 1-decarboxylase [Candidatus Wirthbacteria bacterium]
MQRFLFKSKIHQAHVTKADLQYEGSITISLDLMQKADLWEGEKVLVVDNTNGARLETYTIAGPAGSRDIQMNGAAAHLVHPGDEIIIIAFTMSDQPVQPVKVLVDENNQFVRYL